MLGELLESLNELFSRSSAAIDSQRANVGNQVAEMEDSENEFMFSDDDAETKYNPTEADQPPENSYDNESTESESSTREHVQFPPNATQGSKKLKLSCGNSNQVISSFDKSAEETSQDSGIRSHDEAQIANTAAETLAQAPAKKVTRKVKKTSNVKSVEQRIFEPLVVIKEGLNTAEPSNVRSSTTKRRSNEIGNLSKYEIILFIVYNKVLKIVFCLQIQITLWRQQHRHLILVALGDSL